MEMIKHNMKLLMEGEWLEE